MNKPSLRNKRILCGYGRDDLANLYNCNENSIRRWESFKDSHSAPQGYLDLVDDLYSDHLTFVGDDLRRAVASRKNNPDLPIVLSTRYKDEYEDKPYYAINADIRSLGDMLEVLGYEVIYTTQKTTDDFLPQVNSFTVSCDIMHHNEYVHTLFSSDVIGFSDAVHSFYSVDLDKLLEEALVYCRSHQIDLFSIKLCLDGVYYGRCQNEPYLTAQFNYRDY